MFLPNAAMQLVFRVQKVFGVNLGGEFFHVKSTHIGGGQKPF